MRNAWSYICYLCNERIEPEDWPKVGEQDCPACGYPIYVFIDGDGENLWFESEPVEPMVVQFNSPLTEEQLDAMEFRGEFPNADAEVVSLNEARSEVEEEDPQ